MCNNTDGMKNNKTKDIVCSSHGFQSLGPVYCFTNENVAASMRALGIPRGGRVLTVGASGDHMFEAYLSGASHVDMFDINKLDSKELIKLKNRINLTLAEKMRTENSFYSKIIRLKEDK